MDKDSMINTSDSFSDAMSIRNQKTIYINPNISKQKPNNIHINPLFKHVHINPLFKINTSSIEMSNQRQSNVHINPKMFQPLAHKTNSNVDVKPVHLLNMAPVSKPAVPIIQPSNVRENNINCNKTNPYLFVSNRKLIKNKMPLSNSCESNILKDTKHQIVKSPIFRINRENVTKLPNYPSRDLLKKVTTVEPQNTTLENKAYQRLRRTSLKSKYQVIHSNKKVGADKTPAGDSKYKIDRRLNKSLRSKFGHSFKRDLCHILPTTPKTGRIEKKLSISNKRLVNIGGILYKSTRQKLCLSRRENKTITSVKKLNKCIITVQGAKYVLDQNAKTLKKISEPEKTKKSPLKRINVGGVIYMNKSGTNLVRKTTATTLNNSYGKHRTSMKKNNIVCRLFQRYGYCKRKELGRCNKDHDEKRIAMCKDYLRGSCTKLDCKLSHKPTLEKMPVCLHYLSGSCVRDDCLYLHVKHNDSVPVCDQFLQGYCHLADKCKRRHEFVCPNFDKYGKCNKLKCPLPHKAKSKSSNLLKVNKSSVIDTNILEENKKKKLTETVQEIKKRQEENVRYYEDVSVENNMSGECGKVITENCDASDEQMEVVSITNEDVESATKRPKLGVLPAYIPL